MLRTRPEMKFERYSGTRVSRYLDIPVKHEATMPKVLYEFFMKFVRGKDCSADVRKYLVDATKSDGISEDIQKGIIGEYDGQYIIVFLGVRGLDTCALKITFNDKDKELFRSFIAGCSPTAMSGLFALCIKLLREKQLVRLYKELETNGVLYSSYPEEDNVIQEGFITYSNEALAKSVANAKVIETISDALYRGVSYEEISDVLPKDYNARFMNRAFDDFELMQIEALQPGIAKEA